MVTITEKDNFWGFARSHRLDMDDYTDLIGIVHDWMHMNAIKGNKKHPEWKAQIYLHGHIEGDQWRVKPLYGGSRFEVIKPKEKWNDLKETKTIGEILLKWIGKLMQKG